MYTICIRNYIISEERVIRLYNALILPILLYNSSTWGLTKTQMDKLDKFHRKQLRSMFKISILSNKDLYMVHSGPISQNITRYRWKLLGHILRRPEDITANVVMRKFFKPTKTRKYPRNKPTNLPFAVQNDLHRIIPHNS